MIYTTTSVQSFLASVEPFNLLPPAALEQLSRQGQLLRYRMGQAIVIRDKMPAQISILFEGQARMLGYDPRTQLPVTLRLLDKGAVLGDASLVRGVPCETAIASRETICLTFSVQDFWTLLDQHPLLSQAFHDRASLIEIFDLLGAELMRRADGAANLKDLTQALQTQTVVHHWPAGPRTLADLNPERLWLVSGGGAIADRPAGSRLEPGLQDTLQVTGTLPARILEMPDFASVPPPGTLPIGAAEDLAVADAPVSAVAAMEGETSLESPTDNGIPYAPDRPPEAENLPYVIDAPVGRAKKYPYVRGRGAVYAPLACFQMLAKHLGMPFRRDLIERVLKSQVERYGKEPNLDQAVSLQLYGAIAEMMGLSANLVSVPAGSFGRLPTPALILWQGSVAILYGATSREVILGIPEEGVRRRRLSDFLRSWGKEGPVLLLSSTRQTPQRKFGLGWFLPSVNRYRRVLIEVFIASFFVQLFALANPLMIQVIIDKVIIQNSIDTLQILGIFLVIIAIFEALLSSLRTYLFVDTTNRIDLSLGTEIIDHLLRLPLKYFEQRPVGELSTRVGELERIRQFLTGTALTVVLDSIFSVIYILVMLIYSPLLTAVALSTIPLFVGLAVIASPIIRRQLRERAERNAETQSYLVEVVGGIQTVKAQNIELRSRWQWQDRYARYVSAGFKTVLTSTTANSLTHFLNQISGLLVLWVGAYLVLKGELTLGQLIAFRIIAGYVTTPLLRLAQLWQNFQELALSIERLSDILDTPQEADETDRTNIPMPYIKGAVSYDNVSFRFGKTGPSQLNNITLDFPSGKFVGIVGQSGSGKSTLMKLLPRLYAPNNGRIMIDGYDISKVELYSLRRQIGIVPQDTLLFDASVQENIALTNPEATSEEIIEAAKIAVAHEFVMGLPNGYNTRVGERGSSLSGGQRQRLAIARTILQNPRLLIMDEATSALDYNTERQVCLNLAEAFRGRTVFFITHRLSTIRNADLILMMDQGSVVEQGTHEELMELRGRYFCLYQQQEAQL
ncbi:peptidase domain-containing ABC transporter [Geitlerinema sp. PCC 7407]|uniref:peptidase domain-containing ABC transporter n=1 Tax=Geitlerinema sp. PCC 7407 TaxID=1173025 RepID=UPI00029FB0E6|nr:peptidase domain-containing ABC transporter [Geitlerinema sp. PCC 7407]AFY66910.1 cyclic nucleotide-regulated ABC bacteriocin/lantibiotic exporter [Geitlerinema sp. PCC 7407]